MRQYFIASGILLILPIINFAVAAPMQVQEKRQPPVDMERMPEDTMTTLGKRGDDMHAVNKMLLVFKKHRSKSKSSSSVPAGGWTDLKRPLSPIPEGPEEGSPLSSSDHEPSNPESSTGSGYEVMEGGAPPRASSPALSTMSDAVPKLAGEHGLPNPEPGHLLTWMDAPPLNPVSSTWSHPDHMDEGLMGAHASRPNLGLSDPKPSTSDPRPSTEFDSDHEMLYTAPSSSVSSTNSDRRSKDADTLLGNLQVATNALKGNAKESRRISGTARDVLNAA